MRHLPTCWHLLSRFREIAPESIMVMPLIPGGGGGGGFGRGGGAGGFGMLATICSSEKPVPMARCGHAPDRVLPADGVVLSDTKLTNLETTTRLCTSAPSR